MQVESIAEKKGTFFLPDIDQAEALGTQIQWLDINNTEAGTVLLQPKTDVPPVHFHPHQEELFYVKEGELEVFLTNKWINLKAGNSLKIPRKSLHTYRNHSIDQIVFDFTITPVVRFRKMMEEMGVYVQQGKIRGTDFRSTTYLCRVMTAFPDVTQSVKPPQFFVKCMAFINRVFFR
ncbi:MAG: cupin domain-containing protein [Bacteroidetes bacterium]|nr:cupin domain-containing protein [Bacteroidota bacterium]